MRVTGNTQREGRGAGSAMVQSRQHFGKKRPFEESGDRVYGHALKIKDKKYGLVFLDQAESRRKMGERVYL